MDQLAEPQHSNTIAPRIALVSCVKMKRRSPVMAKDLYVSPLFKLMRQYAERNADIWFILSAEHGVLSPDEVIGPYERTLNSMPKHDRTAWARRVQDQLHDALPQHATIIFLAGQRYREDVIPFLERKGFTVEIPMAGLKLGAQLHWLNKQLQHE